MNTTNAHQAVTTVREAPLRDPWLLLQLQAGVRSRRRGASVVAHFQIDRQGKSASYLFCEERDAWCPR
jgi:hypothetical protein